MIFYYWDVDIPEAAIQKCSEKKVLWKYAANLQEKNRAEVWLISHFGMDVILQTCCISWEHFWLRTPLCGCFWCSEGIALAIHYLKQIGRLFLLSFSCFFIRVLLLDNTWVPLLINIRYIHAIDIAKEPNSHIGSHFGLKIWFNFLWYIFVNEVVCYRILIDLFTKLCLFVTVLC